jgi:hypothetical protein
MLKLATKFAPTAPAFERAHRAGFRFAELWLDRHVLAGWREVVALASAFPLGYALHFPNRLDDPAPALEQTVALYRALGCPALVIHQPMFDRHAAGLLALEPGLRLAIENHKLSPEGLARWAERSPGLTLDVEHLWKITLRDVPLPRLLEELRAFLSRYAGKLRHVHLPGYLPGQPEHRPMYCSRDLVFGAFSLFEEFHVECLLVSEVETEFQNEQELRMDVLLFEAWQARRAAGAVTGP